MIVTNSNVFLLQTKNTAYMFRRLESGHLEHLHYGGLLFPNKNDCLNHLDEVAAAVAPKHFNGAGNLNNYSDEHSITTSMYISMLQVLQQLLPLLTRSSKRVRAQLRSTSSSFQADAHRIL